MGPSLLQWSAAAAMFVAVVLQFLHLAFGLGKWLNWAALPLMLYFTVVQFVIVMRLRRQRRQLR